jgi:hypothetical protein
MCLLALLLSRQSGHAMSVKVPGIFIVLDAVPSLSGLSVQRVVVVELGAFGFVLLAVFAAHWLAPSTSMPPR